MPKNPKKDPFKAWCWTLNNPTEDEEKGIRLWSASRSIYCHEDAPGTGTPHLQGFTIFKTAKRLSGCKKILPRAHWEPAKNIEAAWDYCTKGKDPWYVDNRVGRGKRTDWEEYLKLVREGATDAELLAANPGLFFRYGNGIDRARNALQLPRHHQTKCEWYFGATGSGKSTFVDEAYPDADWCTLTRSGFLLGYHNAPVVVLDDPDLVAMQRELFLNLVNKTPFMMNVKGGQAIWNAQRLIILSNRDPALFHAADAAVQRRIHNRYVLFLFFTTINTYLLRYECHHHPDKTGDERYTIDTIQENMM